MNPHKRYRVGIYIQVLMLIRGGIHTRSNLASFSGSNWKTFISVYDELIGWGYIFASKRTGDGRDVLEVELSDKGKIFLNYVDQFFDLLGKDLNSFFRYS